MLRYLIGFLVTIGLIVLLIVLLVSGGSKQKVPGSTRTLDSYATTDAVVRLTIDGPITAPQNHNEIRITVGRDATIYEQIQGYDGNVVKNQSYDNTQSSYAVFLHALRHAGYTLGTTDDSLHDERGYCPLGNRYIYELTQDGKTIERFWSTTCGKPATFKGNAGLVRTLFQRQVPNYSDLVTDVNIGA